MLHTPHVVCDWVRTYRPIDYGAGLAINNRLLASELLGSNSEQVVHTQTCLCYCAALLLLPATFLFPVLDSQPIRRPSFSSRRHSDLDQSSAARHIRAVTFLSSALASRHTSSNCVIHNTFVVPAE